jgi:hypothetical protein
MKSQVAYISARFLTRLRSLVYTTCLVSVRWSGLGSLICRNVLFNRTCAAVTKSTVSAHA